LIEFDNNSLRIAVNQYASHPDPTSRSVFLYGGCINQWNTSIITNMKNLFKNKNNFNENVGSWDVSKVTTMRWMFAYASSFNQDISSWNIQKVAYMTEMFYSASLFNQNLCSWLNNTSFPSNVHTFWMFKQTDCASKSFPTKSRVCHYCPN